MLTLFEINDITNNVRTENRGDIRHVLEALNDGGHFVNDPTAVERVGEHVAKLSNFSSTNDPPSREDVENIKNRLNDLIGSLTKAGIIE